MTLLFLRENLIRWLVEMPPDKRIAVMKRANRNAKPLRLKHRLNNIKEKEKEVGLLIFFLIKGMYKCHKFVYNNIEMHYIDL